MIRASPERAAGTFVVYAMLTGAALLFTRTQVPETKGRSLEQIEQAMGETGRA